MARAYLTFVGLAYWALAIWCIASPDQTSQAVGFTLQPGTGQSEYLTVYGGLQLGLGLLFFAPWYRKDWTEPMLGGCVLIHACLVVFRSMGFVAFRGFTGTTYGVAVVEWLLLLLGLWCYTRLQRRGPDHGADSDVKVI